ncbi:MAG TPA: hypothetical protein VFL83_16700 [Anaeromyxobacter sp.]|nr:hypothetical protein [Anaeromyxobacter sp.]
MRYCDGLPETGSRPLRADERAAVARLRRRLGWAIAARVALVAASPAAAFALLVAAIALLGEPAGTAGKALQVAAAVATLAGFFVGPAAALLSGRDRWREWRRVRRDLAAAVALEFGDGRRSLAVLPASERVVARDGRPADLAARAPIGSAAPAPPAAATYALAPGALDADVAAREIAARGLVRRALSGEERDELRGHARRLRRVPPGFWLAAAWWGLVAAQWGRGAEPRTAVAVMLTLVLALGLWRLRRARALAGRLEADAEEGWAIRATAGATSGDEALPASRASWTAGGAPAAWRTGARR